MPDPDLSVKCVYLPVLAFVVFKMVHRLGCYSVLPPLTTNIQPAPTTCFTIPDLARDLRKPNRGLLSYGTRHDRGVQYSSSIRGGKVGQTRRILCPFTQVYNLLASQQLCVTAQRSDLTAARRSPTVAHRPY